jgi:hypothetical protein
MEDLKCTNCGNQISAAPKAPQQVSNTPQDGEVCRCPEHGEWLAAEDYYRNCYALDVALNGLEAAAKRPLLIDMLAQVQGIVRERGKPLLECLAQQSGEAVEMDAAYYRAEFERECKDGDALLEIIGICQAGRTDGGSVNIGKVREYQRQTIETLMQLIREKDKQISELSTSPATATASQESAPGQEAVAGFISTSGVFVPIDRTARNADELYGWKTVYFTPPTSTAIAAMVIRQAAEALGKILNEWHDYSPGTHYERLQSLLSNLTPANAEAELVKVIMKVINEAHEYTEEGVRRVLDEKGE